MLLPFANRSDGAGANRRAARTGSFLGREEQVSELAELLADARLITLTGAPGIGKTRLALELGGELAPGYPGGACVVELAAVTDPALVPKALATALSLRETAGQTFEEALLARLAGRPALIVLDNCEHLLGACAKLLEKLIGGCPGLSVLATSREPLGLAEERVWQVPPLSLPDPGETAPQELQRSAAVCLFLERAGAVKQGFALNAYVARAVAEICRRLDGEVERAFRSLKGSLEIRPVHHRLEDRVRSHVFLCMLAYYLEWHLREAWRELTFTDESPTPSPDPVAKASRSPQAERKARTKRTTSGQPCHSFRGLIAELARRTQNTVRIPGSDATFTQLSEPDELQRRALELVRTAEIE